MISCSISGGGGTRPSNHQRHMLMFNLEFWRKRILIITYVLLCFQRTREVLQIGATAKYLKESEINQKTILNIISVMVTVTGRCLNIFQPLTILIALYIVASYEAEPTS